MTRRKLVALAVVTASLGVAGSLTVERPSRGDPGRPPPGLVRQFVGGGGWQHRNDAARQGWQVQLKQLEDGSLAGRVHIVGSPLLDHADIEGQLTGSEVDGVLLDDSGNQVGTFSGSIANGTAIGTYSMADGDVGNWAWEGKVPN